ncbi:MAG TPA: hypothetical protein VF713_16505 [Thermoanaerobaculia bacterium]
MEATHEAHDKESAPRFVVLNMGRQRRKRIKQLKRGKGVLADAVTGSIAELANDGTLSDRPDVVVVVVVKEKEKRTRIPFLGSL